MEMNEYVVCINSNIKSQKLNFIILWLNFIFIIFNITITMMFILDKKWFDWFIQSIGYKLFLTIVSFRIMYMIPPIIMIFLYKKSVKKEDIIKLKQMKYISVVAIVFGIFILLYGLLFAILLKTIAIISTTLGISLLICGIWLASLLNKCNHE